MSYKVRDETKIKAWRVFFSLTSGERVMINHAWKPDDKEQAEKEALRLPEGKVSPRCGWKTVDTIFPTCPKCCHQGEATGMRDYNYNGGGTYYRCLNPECKNEWCWS